MRGHRLRWGVVVLMACVAAPARATESRFFFHGDGVLTLQDGHSHAKLTVRFRRTDGSYDEGALQQIRHLLRSRGDQREGEIALRLIEQIDHVEDLAKAKVLRVVSGYRSPAYNADIRARGAKAASASLHTQGLALDTQFPGIDVRKLWHRLRDLHCCGVGYYNEGGPFLHIDVGPARFWEAATSKVDQNLSGGNARIFARTDFDRYDTLAGAVISLHSVTVFPLRVATSTRVVTADGVQPITLEPADGSRLDGDCLLIDSGEHYRMRVAAAALVPPGMRARLQLRTCEPRIERTPATFETNEFELVAGR